MEYLPPANTEAEEQLGIIERQWHKEAAALKAARFVLQTEMDPAQRSAACEEVLICLEHSDALLDARNQIIATGQPILQEAP